MNAAPVTSAAVLKEGTALPYNKAVAQRPALADNAQVAHVVNAEICAPTVAAAKAHKGPVVKSFSVSMPILVAKVA